MNTNANFIKVWDPFVRLFHWGLALSFFIAFVTEEDFLDIHVIAGYTVLALISARLLWGFVGTRHARFSDFIYSVSEIRQFLKDTLLLKAKRYLGHNPAGGAMIILMILSLFITTLTGMAVYGAEEQAGPLAAWFGSGQAEGHGFWGEALEETHEFFANFTMLLVMIHLAGVLVESLIHRENLVQAMITGFKPSNKNTD